MTIQDATAAGGAYTMSLLFRRYEASTDISTLAGQALGGNTTSITSAINLPLPNVLQEGFSVDYRRQDSTMAKFISQLMSGVAGELGNIMTTGYEQGKSGAALGDAVGSTFADTLNELDKEGAMAMVGALVNGVSGGIGKEVGLDYAFNPSMSNIYNGTAPRTFNFSWKVNPQSAEEAQMYMDIINTIKARILAPEAGKFGPFEMIRYPDVLDITIIGGGANKVFPVVTSLVTDFSVNYGASGAMSFFTDGKPTSIEFTMSVRETHSLTRDKLQKIGGTFGGSTGLNTSTGLFPSGGFDAAGGGG